MRLANDVARCNSTNCERQYQCERYIQRRSGGLMTPHYEHMCDADWSWYIEAEKAGREGE